MEARRVSLMVAAIGAALVLGAGATACCYACGVANPLAAAGGLFQVTCTGVSYTKVQDYPQVMVAKPGTSLTDYMAAEGYHEVEEQRMGSLRFFTNGDHWEMIHATENRFFARWRWQE